MWTTNRGGGDTSVGQRLSVLNFGISQICSSRAGQYRVIIVDSISWSAVYPVHWERVSSAQWKICALFLRHAATSPLTRRGAALRRQFYYRKMAGKAPHPGTELGAPKESSWMSAPVSLGQGYTRIRTRVYLVPTMN